jgi:AcrR family transcriptional regulator
VAKSGIGKRRTAALRDGGEGYAQRRAEIIAAGAQMFREKGFEATSLRDVAELLGADRASLYYYVASKNELFQLVTQRAVEEVVQTAERAASESTKAEDRLRKLVITTVELYEVHFPYMFVYIQEDMNRIHSGSLDEVWARTMLQLGRRYEDALLKIIDDGVAEKAFTVEHRHIAMNFVIGAVNWTHRWFKPGGDLNGKEVGGQLANMVAAGLGA